MKNETPEQRAERKDMYLSKVSALSGGADNYKEIMKEASDKWEKVNLIKE